VLPIVVDEVIEGVDPFAPADVLDAELEDELEDVIEVAVV
jgi:hypothetical protein